MNRLTTRYTALLSIGLIASLVAGCDTMQTSPDKGSANMQEMNIDQMIGMAMKNMEKVMMMPENERQQYVMKTQQDTLARGEELFKSAKLGTSGFSCATCHPGGKTTGGAVPMGDMEVPIPSLVGVAATFPKYKVPNDRVITLAEMNNNCIVMFQKGQPLPLDGNDARALEMFVAHLSKGENYTPGKQGM